MPVGRVSGLAWPVLRRPTRPQLALTRLKFPDCPAGPAEARGLAPPTGSTQGQGPKAGPSLLPAAWHLGLPLSASMFAWAYLVILELAGVPGGKGEALSSGSGQPGQVGCAQSSTAVGSHRPLLPVSRAVGYPDHPTMGARSSRLPSEASPALCLGPHV